ncbi:MAG: hypothetical protein KTR32_22165 [Granulosicoccus sp.]|nr:hypothetical protein [Granulosicoccus sp.]
MDRDGNSLADQAGREKLALAVVVNKSWYEGYVPLFVHFAKRACPHAHVLVYVMGTPDPLVSETLDKLGITPESYTIQSDFRLEYGNSALAAKTSRWTLPLCPIAQSYDQLYVGDIDILLCRETGDSLFVQHQLHAERLGIPISNKVRVGSRRLTGLHYVQTARYLESVLPAIEDLHQFLIDCQHNPQLFSEKYSEPGADENVLYQLVESSEPEWIEQLSQTSFRPHHGVHIGLFRSTPKPGEIGKAVESSILDRNESAFHYWNDCAPELLRLFEHESTLPLFDAYPRVKAACHSFLVFYRDWHNGAYQRLLAS